MTTAYTSLLGLALPVTGELSGTWGDTVNNSITSLLDSAIAGTQTLTADTTLTTTTGAANQSRQAILLCSPASANITITAPAQSKIYTVINTSATYTVTVRGVGPTTGVTLGVSEKAVVAWNGSDFIKISNTAGAGSFTSLTASTTLGVTGVSTLTGGATIQGLTVGRGAGAVVNNTAVGASALAANTTGSTNSAFARLALQANTTGSNNTAVGNFSMYSNTTGGNNTAIGEESLQANTTANNNTAVGYQAAYSNTTGTRHSAFGLKALYTNTTGTNNNAFGIDALGLNTTGSNNTAFGDTALGSNTTASNNTAVGYQAAYSNTTGTQNIAIGTTALYTASTVNNNTAVGHTALYTTTTGGHTAVGLAALYANTTGTDNASFGAIALRFNTTGANNVALGYAALYSNTTASNNTAVGYQAGYSNTTSANNTFLGYQTGYAVSTGTANTLIGIQAGYGTTNLTTGTNNTLIGAGASTSAGGDNHSITISTTSVNGKGSTTGFISPNGGGVYQGNNSSSWSTTSDQRLKKNIVDNNAGLDIINQIQVRNFEYRLPEEITEVPQNQAIEKQGVQLGVIAQELQQVLPDCVKTESTGVMSVDADNLTWYLVNAIKELKAEVDSLKSQLNQGA